jgi:molybdate transport repressor ModE-like protein
MSGTSRPQPSFKVWLETEDGFVLGPGVYNLLRKALKTGTLKDSAKALGMSYRFAWGLLRKAEERLGQPLIETHKGGRSGGGGVELTEVGQAFLEEFSKIETLLNKLLETPQLLEKDWIESSLNTKIKEITRGEKGIEIVVETAKPIRLTLNLPSVNTLLENIHKGDELSLVLISTTRSIEKKQH